MRRLQLVLLALSLAACSATDNADADSKVQTKVESAAASAVAPPSPVVMSPLQVAARAFAEGEAEPGGQGLILPNESLGGFDLIDCSEEVRSPDPAGASPGDAMVARRIALLRLSLERSGYPMQVLRPILARFEAAEQARVAAGEEAGPGGEAQYARMQALAAELDAARAQASPEMPAIVAEGGCGGGESEFIVRTAPVGGRVWIMTRFNFQLCSARGLDPWDRNACPHWTETDSQAPIFLSGAYVWQARWPDGGTARGDRRLAFNRTEAPIVMTVSRG